MMHNISHSCRVLAKEVSMFTLSGFSVALLRVTMLPDVLNNLSEAQLVVLIHKYFLCMQCNHCIP